MGNARARERNKPLETAPGQQLSYVDALANGQSEARHASRTGAFGIQPEIHAHHPDLEAMLAETDAALIIGDNALFLESAVEKIDLGEEWSAMTGLPFVWAFWAGRPGALRADDVDALQRARDDGVKRPEELARQYVADAPERQEAAARYLRQNIKYYLGSSERAGLEMFYRYAAEAGLVSTAAELRFFGQP